MPQKSLLPILIHSWAYESAWIPEVVMIYHSLNYWFWIGNHHKIGIKSVTTRLRISWFLLNLVTGILVILIAW